ncbi:MAG: hypothetical protein HYV35_08745 [Lentisphaerae bacterium]|nr:hypothetical protein [Lentisphaerota bacterium]
MACGYPTSSHVYHLRTGTWKRDYRGIYRLARFPVAEDAQYVMWSLWSRNRNGTPQGVYSHQTALVLFDLSDLMPRRLYMTVPPGFRRNAPVPDVLILHRGRLAPSELEARSGYRVTRPLRAITDLLKEAAVSADYLSQALQQALERGLITSMELEKHPLVERLKKLLAKDRA